MSELFFNARSWRQLGLGEQEIKFLEELWRRAGGAPPPNQNLGQVTETVSVLETSVSQQSNLNNLSRRDLVSALSLAQEKNQGLEARLKRLDLRINQLEDAQ